MTKPTPSRHQPPRIAPLAAGALLLGMVSTAALADVAALAGGGGKRPAFSGQPALQLAQVQRNDRAREQASIGRLEEEIRRLNGRIEELEFQQRRTDQRMDQVIDDLEQRLASPGNEQGGDGPEPLIVEQTERSPEDALRDLLGNAEEGSLGSVPQSAIAKLPRPNAADIAAPEKKSVSAEQQYEDAIKLLQAGNYQGAQTGLELFLEAHPDHQLASNAAYWLAETHYVRQNYSAAAATFARNYGNYGKESPKAIDNLLKLGMSLSNLGETENACLSYDELENSFPNPPAQIQQAVNRERARARCS
jgi:tol-pal system protein YbgF